jgi:allophanate hydrolase
MMTAQTAAHYKLYALPGTTPPKPGLLRVEPHAGGSITVEIWDMPVEHYGSFVALIPAPLGIGTLTLSDGAQVQGFLCEPMALLGAQDITEFKGWRNYMASLQKKEPA